MAVEGELTVKELALVDAQLARLHLQLSLHLQLFRQQQLLFAGDVDLVLLLCLHIFTAGFFVRDHQYRPGQALWAATAGRDLGQSLAAIGLSLGVKLHDGVQGQLQ